MAVNTTKKYSQALVEICRDNNCWDEMLADLQDVSSKLNETLELKRFLNDNQVELSQKQAALKTVFRDFIGQKTYNFLFLLIKAKKLSFLDTIILQAQKLNLEIAGLNELIVESAIPLTAIQEKELKLALEHKYEKTLFIKNIVNRELIGGVRIFLGDITIDSSILGKIERLKRKIEFIG